ncbi:MAG: fused MFS/spermidine synthase [bacterium]|nr:fused MFS/spermidine synthase [bacterium]
MLSINRQNNSNIVLLSFGILGLTSLIFQVVFAKNLVLLFGLTAPAVSTVLAVFFSGLALGSLIFGKLADKFSEEKTFKFYTAFFVLTAFYGFLFPLIFKLLNFLILAINSVSPLNFSGFNFVAFLFSFIFIAPVSILFGAGFPVVSKILVYRESNVGKKVSFLYFINTFGSVLGAALAGFWLIPFFGNNATIFSAAVLNLVVGGLLYFFSKSEITNSKSQITNNTQIQITNNQTSQKLHNPLFLYALFITGFLALALEVLYTKTLILFIGSSTYAFSLILITFLLGIALGSWALSFFVDQIKRGYAYFGLFLGLIGFWLFLTLQFFEKVPFWYLNFLGSRESFEFGSVILSQSLVTFLVIFPATFLMGVIFPLGIHLARPHITNLGGGVGKLYFANTFGGVLGSLTAGFLFLPILGYTRALILILAIYFALGGFFVAREKGMGWAAKGAFIFFFAFWAIFAVFSSPWGKKNLTVGTFPYAPLYLGYGIDAVKETIERDRLLFYKEGLSNVAVMQRGPNRILKVNGKVDASNSVDDLETMVLLGALPMILHQNPQDVLVIGLGSGITLGSVAQFDSAKDIDVVEISPAIVEAASYFKESNHDALNDPRVNIILADGRNHLLLADKKYDVISSQPSNLWVEGNANLFTKEFYELTRSRLKENGLMFQWIQAYALTSENVRSVYKTFQEVFPYVYLFNASNSGDMFVIGAMEPDAVALNFGALSEKMADEKIANELFRIYVATPYEFLAYLVSEGERLREFVKDARVNIDDKNFLEFSAPKSIYQSTITEALRDIDSLRNELNLFIFGLEEGGELERLKKHFQFRKALLPVQAALSEVHLYEAVEGYGKARDENGVILPSMEIRISQACTVAGLFARENTGAKAAEDTWKKCEEVFGPIKLPF